MRRLCGNCVDWTALVEKAYSDQHIKLPTTQGNCACEKFVYDGDEKPEVACDLLLYRDDDNYGAFFTTCSHFGCIHFKARP